MNTVIVKLPYSSISEEHWPGTHELRQWCHKHLNEDWRSYYIDRDLGMAGEGAADHIYLVFEFENPKEALKFRLWSSACIVL